jgi:hypothetical protein
MSAALQTANLPPEAISLIKEGSPKPKVEAPVIAVVSKPEHEKTIDVALTGDMREEAIGNKKEGEAQTLPIRNMTGSKKVKENEAEAATGHAFVPMTFRVPSAILAGLLRACADRKIKKTRPYTQQQIVAEALTQWLKGNGYLA